MSGLELNTFFEINQNSTKTPINPCKSMGVVSLLIDYTHGNAIDIINNLLHPLETEEEESDLSMQANSEEIIVNNPLPGVVRKRNTVVDHCYNSESDAEQTMDVASYTNWLIHDESKSALMGIKDMVFAFQQGWDYLNPLQWLTGYLVMEKYYKAMELNKSLTLIKSGDINQYIRIKQIHDYAFSAYGWQVINFFQKGQGMLKAAFTKGANEQTIRQYLKHLEQDEYILYNEGDQFIPAHLMIYDKVDNAIVVSIRGTLSLTDSLIDFTCEYAPFLNGFAHKGIVATAKKLKELLMTEIYHNMVLFQANKLILTGHSLGSGIASILLILLVQDGFKYDIIAYTFGCPPIVSRNIANQYDSYIRSFIYRYDLIPRLSYGTVSDLVTTCATVMTNSNLMAIFNKKELVDEFDIIYKCKMKYTRKHPQHYHPKLYIPGVLYYLDDDALYKCNREISEEIILVTPEIYKDHLPGAYDLALSRLCTEPTEQQ